MPSSRFTQLHTPDAILTHVERAARALRFQKGEDFHFHENSVY